MWNRQKFLLLLLFLVVTSVVLFNSTLSRATLNGPLVIDEGQPKVISSISGSCNATSYPLFLSTHVPCVSTQASSNWQQNKQGVCMVKQKAIVMRELGKVIGPVTSCILKRDSKKNKIIKEKKEKKEKKVQRKRE